MNYIELVDILNEMHLDLEAKHDIVDAFRKHDIELCVCDNCFDISIERLTYDHALYCSYDCMINDMDITEDNEESQEQ